MTTLVLSPVQSGASRKEIVIANLNARWRVVDDPLQWILQVRKGRPTAKASGWRDRRFHVQRTALMRSVAELCGPVEPEACRMLAALPATHPSPTKARHDG